MRLIGLKALPNEARSDGGFKSVANWTGVVDGAATLGRLDTSGLAFAPPGVNALAPGFGLNSIALTLNLLDAADVGLIMPDSLT